jgi:hypothetical protein
MKTSGKGTILLERRCRGLVVMMEDLSAEPGKELKDWVDQKCLEHKTEQAFFTDGQHWGLRRVRSVLPLEIVDLFEAVKDQKAFTSFLRQFGEV